MKRRNIFFISLFCLALSSCGDPNVDTGENFGNLLNTALALTLTEAEHKVGWGKSECTMCHSLENIHLVDHSGGVDIQTIHNNAIRDGITGCSACHGNNGVP